jgi:hypothetical protein
MGSLRERASATESRERPPHRNGSHRAGVVQQSHARHGQTAREHEQGSRRDEHGRLQRTAGGGCCVLPKCAGALHHDEERQREVAEAPKGATVQQKGRAAWKGEGGFRVEGQDRAAAEVDGAREAGEARRRTDVEYSEQLQRPAAGEQALGAERGRRSDSDAALHACVAEQRPHSVDFQRGRGRNLDACGSQADVDVTHTQHAESPAGDQRGCRGAP